jgi:hypothetical protein
MQYLKPVIFYIVIYALFGEPFGHYGAYFWRFCMWYSENK